jgi:lipid-A-disaccharide synthase
MVRKYRASIFHWRDPFRSRNSIPPTSSRATPRDRFLPIQRVFAWYVSAEIRDRMKIFFSAGEPSGDLHGANLIRELRERCPVVQAVGYGGPEMAAAGCQLHTDLTALAVMWIVRVAINIHKFLALAGRADRYFRHHRPDAVVLIDYPGFNWWIARRAKAHGIPVFYFAPPQVWAWATHRIRKVRRFVDHVLCSLPFEQQWYRERGANATFIGHPFFDEVARQRLDASFLAKQRDPSRPLVALLPGSRTQEVEHNLKYFLKAAALIHAQVPSARFAIASFKPHQAEYARAAVKAAGLPIEVHLKRTPELIHLADCCLAVSGSVSLELLAACKPTAILYWISPLGYALQRRYRRVKYITLVNLLSAAEPFSGDATTYDPERGDTPEVLYPEYVTCEDKSRQLAGHAVEWLTDRAGREQLVARLAELKAEVGHGGAARTAAAYILEELNRRPAPQYPPHYIPAAGMVLAPSLRPRGAKTVRKRSAA